MNYWDKWALNPVEFLRVGSSICISLMGFADALIFSLREKPWRGIEESDGSFWGSFVIRMSLWGARKIDGADEEQVAPHRGSQSYRTSATGESARIAAEQARHRLDLEREERRKAIGNRSSNDFDGDSEGGYDEADDGEQREHGGLNVGDGGKGQVYDDNGLEDDTAETEYNSRK